ncbi:MAG: hypothetical protein ACREI7_08080 [Myxococcota bacterium]
MNAAVLTDVDALRAQLDRLKAEREQLVDALDHIQRTCAGSRTQTRRLRWIALRAKCAIEGNDEWRVADVPVNDPLIEKLRELLTQIFPFVSRELVFTLDNYTTLGAKRKEATFAELLASINERDVHDDCKMLREFLQATRRNVPEINIEELRKGGEWIDLT